MTEPAQVGSEDLAQIHASSQAACRLLTHLFKPTKIIFRIGTVRTPKEPISDAMIADNIRFGFARLALVAAWIVAIPWLIFLAGWSVRAFQAANWNWESFKLSAILVVPVCKLVSWTVKTVGWVIAGFATPGPEPEIEQQAFRAFARDKAVFFNIWLIGCWVLVWEAADFAGSVASSYDYSILAGRVTGFLMTAILLLVATIVVNEIVELLIRKILKPCGADFTKYELQCMERRRFGLPFR
jgi:hypothetical protein